MAKLANKYEKMIEYEDKKFYRKLKAKKKAKNKPTPKKKKPKKTQGRKERPFIPYRQQLLDERWKKKREQVLEHKGRKCEMCGATQNLQIHHRRYICTKYAWEYKMKDLLVLCGCCHQKVHGIDLDKRMDELIGKCYMIPKIIKPREQDLIWNKEVKWVVVSKYECMNYDLCYSLGDAIRYWLWHMGVNPKIAFGWFSKYKQSKDEDDDND